jgi:Ca2+-binding EF-hand superfamily protein
MAFTAFPVTLMIIPPMATRANEPTVDEIEAGFVKLDQDKSGALDEGEFSLAKERIRGELKSHFIGLVRFDRMGETAMPRLFSRLDSDGDGKLNKVEFKNLRVSLTELLKSRSTK